MAGDAAPPLPDDPESKAMLALLSQVVMLMRRQGGLAALVVVAITNQNERIGGHHLTDRTDFVVVRGLLETIRGMVDDEERERRQQSGGPSGLVDPSGAELG